MANIYPRFPKLLSRIAHEDDQEEIDYGRQEDAPDTDLDCHEHEQVCFTVRYKYPEALEQNRELDEEDIGDVDDCGDVVPLVDHSMSNSEYLGGGRSYIDHLREGTEP